MLIISNAPPFEQYHNAQQYIAVYKRMDCIVNCSRLTYEQIIQFFKGEDVNILLSKREMRL